MMVVCIPSAQTLGQTTVRHFVVSAFTSQDSPLIFPEGDVTQFKSVNPTSNAHEFFVT